jgi:hypothetical protein
MVCVVLLSCGVSDCCDGDMAVTLVTAAVLLASCGPSGTCVVVGGRVQSGIGVASGWVGGSVGGGWNCPAVSLGVWTLFMEIGVSLSLMMLS